MPLFYSHIVNETTKLAVWEIGEPEDFFFQYVPLGRDILHPHKRLQHLAGRFLLQYLFPDFPISEIQVATTRKPFLETASHHFSISHCGNFAAAIVSTSERTGIDIEIPGPKIMKVRYKFLAAAEFDLLTLSNLKAPEPGLEHEAHILYPLTVAWSAKEAMFKWYGKGGVDFRGNMQLSSIHQGLDSGLIQANFSKEESLLLECRFMIFPSLVLSWVVTPK